MDNPLTKDQKQDKTTKPEVESTHKDTIFFKLPLRNKARSSNSNAFDALEWRKPILDNLMLALSDHNTHIIGVCGSSGEIKDTLLQRVQRRVDRDMLFDVVVTASVTKKPDLKKIQEGIAGQLGFSFEEKSKDKRAIELLHRIKKSEQRILIILSDVYEGLDLGKIGIPLDADHEGCKILLSSTSEDVLIKKMHAQKIFKV